MLLLLMLLLHAGTRKVVYPDGIEESVFPDGVKVIEYPQGFRDVTTLSGVTHREHADGNVEEIRQL
jgi:hypothetical protein